MPKIYYIGPVIALKNCEVTISDGHAYDDYLYPTAGPEILCATSRICSLFPAKGVLDEMELDGRMFLRYWRVIQWDSKLQVQI